MKLPGAGEYRTSKRHKTPALPETQRWAWPGSLCPALAGDVLVALCPRLPLCPEETAPTHFREPEGSTFIRNVNCLCHFAVTISFSLKGESEFMTNKSLKETQLSYLKTNGTGASIF